VAPTSSVDHIGWTTINEHGEDIVMGLNKRISISGIAILSMVACGVKRDNNTSSVSAAITGGVFDGNSVQIIAHRNGAADTKYRCVSDTSGCFNFGTGSNGVPTPVPGDTGAENFKHLCPTLDVNESDAAVSDAGAPGTWTFTYHIWSQPNCTGTELTAPDNNFMCFSESDLASQAFPNQTANETLLPGPVVNTVLCTSENTQKHFDFNSCEMLPAPVLPDGGVGDVFDCGCTRTGTAACACNFDITTLPPECSFDTACNLLCVVQEPLIDCCQCFRGGTFSCTMWPNCDVPANRTRCGNRCSGGIGTCNVGKACMANGRCQ
jgi:hypothetical protein